MSLLTIAIPTYNRNETLVRTICYVLPQMTDECELLIIDNRSDTPVADSLQALLAQFPSVRCSIVRNRVNIGGAANILRCFELCETEWMWLLGDDDIVTQNAVDIVMRCIREHPECLFINFAGSRGGRKAGYTTEGIDDFVTRMDNWSNVLFMSVGGYRTGALRKCLPFGYHYSYSKGPHVAIVLSALRNGGGTCYFSPDKIISDSSIADETWQPVSALLGKMVLLELVDHKPARVAFARHLAYRPSLEASAVFLHTYALDSGRRHMALFWYDQVCLRVFYYDRRIFTRVRIRLYRLLVRYPRWTRPIMAALFPIMQGLTGFTRVGLADVKVGDIFQRL